jgi:serine-type D-Ala-D-Ala carboxypeptidase/endopeptidase
MTNEEGQFLSSLPAVHMRIALYKPLIVLLLFSLCLRCLGRNEERMPGTLTTNEVKNTLRDYIEVDHLGVGLVVGIVDEHGPRVISHGKFDDGTTRDVDGDTLFNIASVSKVFTALLLQDMVERGEMKLDDPVQTYLPASVRLPTYRGKEITLLHLATHTSGLPRDVENATPATWRNPLKDYKIEQWHDFLSHCKLAQAPGTKWNYSNVEMQLLAYAIALKAGTNFETLLRERICRPLGMDSTAITLSPELKSRCAIGHALPDRRVCAVDDSILPGASGMHTTANDLLKFISAWLDLTPSPLTSLMQKTQAFHTLEDGTKFRLAWFGDENVLSHAGDDIGFTADLSINLKERRGAVALANCCINKIVNDASRGWREGRSPKPIGTISVDSSAYDGYVGQYRNAEGEVSTLRRDGERLLARWIGKPNASSPSFFTFELFPQSELRFSNSFWNCQATIVRGADGEPTKLIVSAEPGSTEMVKISTNLPATPSPVVANAALYNRYAGQYRLPCLFGILHVGPYLNVGRETDEFGDHLVAWISGKIPGNVAVLGSGQRGGELWPKSETIFWSPLAARGLRVTFVQNKKGKTTGAVVHYDGADYHVDRVR